MIPVLSVSDIDGASATLRRLFGFAAADSADGTVRMALGDQQIAIVTAAPPGMLPIPLDHLALRVGSADAAMAEIAGRGGKLSAAFTPEGPRDIPDFLENGVRFVFFDGPEGWPFEFCARTGRDTVAPGHDHYGLRTPDADALEARLVAMGATRIAAHVLAGPPPVEVRFLALGGRVYEIFDEGPFPPPQARGFIGLMPA